MNPNSNSLSDRLTSPGGCWTLVNIIVLMGLMSLVGSAACRPPKRSPEKSGMLTVEIVYSGASPAEVEELVTAPVEEALGTIAGIGVLSSVSAKGIARITTRVLPKDRARILAATRNRLGRLRRLPENVDRPHVYFQPQPEALLLVAVTGTAHQKVFAAAQKILDRLQRLPRIQRVVVHGLDSRRLLVEVDPRRARQLGLTVREILQSVRKHRPRATGDNARTSRGELMIRVKQPVESVESFLHQRILAGLPNGAAGNVAVRLSSVASLQEKPDPERAVYSSQGAAVLLVITARPGRSALLLSLGVRRALSQTVGSQARLVRSHLAGPLETAPAPIPRAGQGWDHMLHGPVLVVTATPRANGATSSPQSKLLGHRLAKATRETLGNRNLRCVLHARRPLILERHRLNQIQLVAFLTPDGHRRGKALTTALWKRLVKNPELTSLQISGSGRRTVVELAHQDIAVLRRVTRSLAAALKVRPWFSQVVPWGTETKPEILITPNSASRKVGLGLAHLSGELRPFTGGVVATKVQRGRSELPVLVRASVTLNAKTASQISIRTPRKALVPLSHVAMIQLRKCPAAILRHASRRISNVTFRTRGAARPGKSLRELLQTLRRNHPGLVTAVRR